jgi:hypothetical protein
MTRTSVEETRANREADLGMTRIQQRDDGPKGQNSRPSNLLGTNLRVRGVRT